MKILTVVAAAISLLAPTVALADNINSNSFIDSDDFAGNVSNSELDRNRGEGYSFQFSTIAATLSNNTVIGGKTGDNTISNSFNNNAGISSVILNSGNNVVIQSAILVNVGLQ